MKYTEIKIGAEVLVKDEYKHWKGEIVSKVKKSRTKVIVKILERGEGWDDTFKKYTGVSQTNEKGIVTGWSRGENHDYKDKVERHIKEVLQCRK